MAVQMLAQRMVPASLMTVNAHHLLPLLDSVLELEFLQ